MIRSLFESEDSPAEEKKSSESEEVTVSDPATAVEPGSGSGSPALTTPVFRESAGTAEAGSNAPQTTGEPELATSAGSFDVSTDDDHILELESPTDGPDEFRRMEEELAAVERELKAEREIENRRSSTEPESGALPKWERSGETPVLAAFDRSRITARENSPAGFEKNVDDETIISRTGPRAEEMEEPAIFRSGDRSAASDQTDSAKAAGQFPWAPNIPTILDSGAEAATPGEPGFQPESRAEVIRQSGLAWTAATVLFGSIAFLLIIGWFGDLLLGSSPWGVIAGIVIGSLIGFVQFFRLTSQILKK